ncbi:MAG: phosphoadenosine phosphosulfate reductase [Actinomycetota bacterium]|jgi:phosphoadenosine phosphosulfate reductase
MQALPLSAVNVSTLNKQFETWKPQDIIAWAHATFGEDLVVTSSFGDPVLAHMTWSTVKGSTVTLIDTQYLFAQTMWYAKVLSEQTAGNLKVIAPAETVVADDLWQRDTDACCAIRKVAPLEHALSDKSAWMTGLRRDDSASRANTPVISHDMLRDVIKVNPLANFTQSDYNKYLEIHSLTEHPLASQGYTSIGCWPCTRPSIIDGDARSGRWAGTEKTECGLHARVTV